MPRHVTSVDGPPSDSESKRGNSVELRHEVGRECADVTENVR